MQGMGDDRSVKNRWLWKGMQRLGLEVLNVAEDDIAELQALGVNLQGSDRFISANLISTKTGGPLLKPYIVKPIALKGSSQKYRVGFLGLSGRESFLKTDAAGYSWADPQASARKWLPELRKECDFLIVLACLPAREAVQLAVDNSTIDIIVTGFKHQMSDLPARINQSTIIYAEDEGKILGELRFSVVRGQKVDVQPRNHPLTRNVKDEPGSADQPGQGRHFTRATCFGEPERSASGQRRNFVLRYLGPLRAVPCRYVRCVAKEPARSCH